MTPDEQAIRDASHRKEQQKLKADIKVVQAWAKDHGARLNYHEAKKLVPEMRRRQASRERQEVLDKLIKAAPRLLDFAPKDDHSFRPEKLPKEKERQPEQVGCVPTGQAVLAACDEETGEKSYYNVAIY